MRSPVDTVTTSLPFASVQPGANIGPDRDGGANRERDDEQNRGELRELHALEIIARVVRPCNVTRSRCSELDTNESRETG